MLVYIVCLTLIHENSHIKDRSNYAILSPIVMYCTPLRDVVSLSPRPPGSPLECSGLETTSPAHRPHCLPPHPLLEVRGRQVQENLLMNMQLLRSLD